MKSLVEIIENIKKLKSLSSDAEVAELLGMKKQTLATAKMRNSIPFEILISFCQNEGVSLDWLFLTDGTTTQKTKKGSLKVPLHKSLEYKEKIEEIIGWLNENQQDANLILKLIRSKRDILEVFHTFNSQLS